MSIPSKLKKAGTCLWVLMTVGCLFCACPVKAEEAKDVLRVPFAQFVPWKTVMGDGRLSGIDIELMEIIADKMNLKLEVTRYPWKRGLKYLEDGKIDIHTSLLRRPQREAFAYFIDPPYVTRSNKAFFVLQGKEATIGRYEDLKGLRIGVFEKNHYFKQFDQDSSLNKVHIKTTEQMFQMVAAGRLDAFVMTQEVGEYKLREFGFDDRIVKASYVYSKPMDVHLALSKKSPLADRRDEISSVLQDLLDQGVVEQLKKKYLHSPE